MHNKRPLIGLNALSKISLYLSLRTLFCLCVFRGRLKGTAFFIILNFGVPVVTVAILSKIGRGAINSYLPPVKRKVLNCLLLPLEITSNFLRVLVINTRPGVIFLVGALLLLKTTGFYLLGFIGLFIEVGFCLLQVAIFFTLIN